jgi:hypothetical protein
MSPPDIQLPDAAYCVKHPKEIVTARALAYGAADTNNRATTVGLGVARVISFGKQELEGEAFAQHTVSLSLIRAAAVGWAFGSVWRKPDATGDNAAMFTALVDAPGDFPPVLQAVWGFALRGGVVFARTGEEALTAIDAAMSWPDVERMKADAWGAARAGVVAGWERLIVLAGP